MIFGIGIDIVKTGRLQSAVERWGDRFLKRVYTESEIAYAYGKSNPFLSLSARFAAKEAMIKAIGRRTSVSLTDIEIVNTEEGIPSIRSAGELKKFFEAHQIQLAHVTLSHEAEYSVACVVLEK